ncbi:MAG: contact-dependent growth inhibition system immunity protein [Luteimonas sp.]|nr:contact-dependent growth inhibition system immunity protein [Luteimonas sp.]
MHPSNHNKSLEQLEGDRWGEPDFQSHLVTECHRLRKVAIGQFSVENLRIMIGQGFGLQHLVPIALERLYDNPFVEGDFYPGDLLLALAKAPSIFWEANPDLMTDMQAVIGRAERAADLVRDELLPAWATNFR